MPSINLQVTSSESASAVTTGAGDEYSEDKFRQKKAHVPRTLRMELRDTARSSKANSTFHQTLQDIHTRKYTNPDLTQKNKPAVRIERKGNTPTRT